MIYQNTLQYNTNHYTFVEFGYFAYRHTHIIVNVKTKVLSTVSYY